MTLTSFVTFVTFEDTSPLLERGRQEVRCRLRHGDGRPGSGASAPHRSTVEHPIAEVVDVAIDRTRSGPEHGRHVEDRRECRLFDENVLIQVHPAHWSSTLCHKGYATRRPTSSALPGRPNGLGSGGATNLLRAGTRRSAVETAAVVHPTSWSANIYGVRTRP